MFLRFRLYFEFARSAKLHSSWYAVIFQVNNRESLKKNFFHLGGDPTLLITTDADIRYLSLALKEYGLIKSDISHSHGVASVYEDNFGFVYWNEKNQEKSSAIYKSMLDGSDYQPVVSIGVEMVEDLAVDWVARHIYFTDSSRKHIVVCDLPGIICAVIMNRELDKPRAVAVYPEKSLLFWTDWGSNPHIGSAGMDGSRQTKIISTNIIWPNGLVVDDTIQRIFWTDAKLNRIESSRIDGTDRKILPVKVSHPYAVEVFENMIYWCDPIEHKVLSANKFTGKERKVLIKMATSTVTGIHVHHPSKQRSTSNPCKNVVCSHLCLLAPSLEGFSCSCPMGMTLNKNNRTCDSSFNQPSAIVIATSSDLYRLTYHQIGKDSIVRLPTRNLGNIGALAFDPMSNCIVYSDLKHKAIYSMSLDAFHQNMLFSNVGTVEGLDVDPYTENIYWTESTQGIVAIGYKNRYGVYERLVLARKLQTPKSITLAPQFGLMFIVEGRVSHVISVWHMDGSWRQKLVRVYGKISAMSFDGKHLYFSDGLRGTVERIKIDGQDRAVLHSNLDGTLMVMDTSADLVFWLTQYSSRISWFDKEETKIVRNFAIDSSENNSVRYRLMVVLENFVLNRSHVCLSKMEMCSDICVPGPKEAKCLCPVDTILSKDEESCVPTDCSGQNWFKCQTGCILSKFQCDGVIDCALGEDEEICHDVTTTATTCSSEQFQCKNGDCILSHFYCDGDADCEDGSDEPNTCPPHKCLSESDYPCPNQHMCIPRSAMCDGYADCADKSDESNCIDSRTNCSSSQFNCTQSQMCIPEVWVCDGATDCEHGEDEEENFCSNTNRKTSCPANSVRCPSGSECIPRMTLCNNAAECDQLSDEELCAEFNAKPVEECPLHYFNCFKGSDGCISVTSR